METLTLAKRLGVVRKYLTGFSYDEIAGQVKVSKGSVANIVEDLKAGRILQVDVTDHVEACS